jgi:hypothetical protein
MVMQFFMSQRFQYLNIIKNYIQRLFPAIQMMWIMMTLEWVC